MKKCYTYFTLILILINSFAFAGEQPKTVKAKGIIISGKIADPKNNESLAGVKISCSNCEKTFYSDLDGHFFIYLETENINNLKLEFSQVGYSSKSLGIKEIQATSDNLVVDLQSE